MYNQKTINAWAEEDDKPSFLMELSICFNQQFPELLNFEKVSFAEIYHFLKRINEKEKLRFSDEVKE